VCGDVRKLSVGDAVRQAVAPVVEAVNGTVNL
jgi:hypothetical protein